MSDHKTRRGWELFFDIGVAEIFLGYRSVLIASQLFSTTVRRY
jgi:hypothetical protein